jgi:hypothetical protein
MEGPIRRIVSSLFTQAEAGEKPADTKAKIRKFFREMWSQLPVERNYLEDELRDKTGCEVADTVSGSYNDFTIYDATVYRYTTPYTYRLKCPDGTYDVKLKNYVEVTHEAEEYYVVVAYYDKSVEVS